MEAKRVWDQSTMAYILDFDAFYFNKNAPLPLSFISESNCLANIKKYVVKGT
jgi:hypothetical protein